jgi:hypothetical protein
MYVGHIQKGKHILDGKWPNFLGIEPGTKTASARKVTNCRQTNLDMMDLFNEMQLQRNEPYEYVKHSRACYAQYDVPISICGSPPELMSKIYQKPKNKLTEGPR